MGPKVIYKRGIVISSGWVLSYKGLKANVFHENPVLRHGLTLIGMSSENKKNAHP